MKLFLSALVVATSSLTATAQLESPSGTMVSSSTPSEMYLLNKVEDLKGITPTAVQFKNVATGHYIVYTSNPKGGGVLECSNTTEVAPWYFYRADNAEYNNVAIKRQNEAYFNWSNYTMKTDQQSFVAYNHAKRYPNNTNPGAPHDWTLINAESGKIRIEWKDGNYLQEVAIPTFLKGSVGPKVITKEKVEGNKHQLWEVYTSVNTNAISNELGDLLGKHTVECWSINADHDATDKFYASVKTDNGVEFGWIEKTPKELLIGFVTDSGRPAVTFKDVETKKYYTVGNDGKVRLESSFSNGAIFFPETPKATPSVGKKGWYSFQSKVKPGKYLRHYKYALQVDAIRSGNDVNAQDATFKISDNNGLLSEYALDGSKYIHVNNAPSLNPGSHLSVQARVNLSDHSSQALVHKWGGSQSQYSMEIYEGKPTFVVKCGITKLWIVSAPDKITLNEWTTITGTYDGSIIRIYVNGVEKGATKVIGALNIGDGPVIIGKRSDGDSGYLNGSVGVVSVHSTCLTPAQALGTEDIPSSSYQLLFNDYSTGNTVNDASGNKNTGTIMEKK